MIVCSCNVLSDKEILSVVERMHHRPKSISEFYACLGYRPKCGGCVPTIKKIRDESSVAQ